MRENVAGGRDATWRGPLEPAAGGMSTFIWFGQLDGDDLPDAFRAPLALRIYGTTDDDATLERERAVLAFVTDAGYPAPVPLAGVGSGSPNPVGLPWMVLPRIDGEPLLTVLAQAPWTAPARLRELAALHARLHVVPVAGCPLPAAGQLVDRWLEERAPEIESIGDARADAVLDALRRRADVVRNEEPVVCHGDFHPLNVLSSRTGSQWRHVVIDWTDAAIGDRHFDVARTLVLFRVASIAASGTAERVGLRAAGPALVRIYRSAYERARVLEPARLRYWSAAHLLRGWAQVTRLHEGAYGTTAATTDAVPASAADMLLKRAERAAAMPA